MSAHAPNCRAGTGTAKDGTKSQVAAAPIGKWPHLAIPAQDEVGDATDFESGSFAVLRLGLATIARAEAPSTNDKPTQTIDVRAMLALPSRR